MSNAKPKRPLTQFSRDCGGWGFPGTKSTDNPTGWLFINGWLGKYSRKDSPTATSLRLTPERANAPEHRAHGCTTLVCAIFPALRAIAAPLAGNRLPCVFECPGIENRRFGFRTPFMVSR